MNKRRGDVTVDFSGSYPIFKKVNDQLVKIEKADSGRRYGLVTDLAEGASPSTYYLQFTDEEEAAADAQKAAWDAGAKERDLEEIRVAEEAAKFEKSLKFETRITAFIDVLGWKNAVEDAAKGENDRVLALGKALASMQGYSKFAESLRGLAPQDERWPGDPMVSQFSDSLLLSYSDDRSGRDALKQALYILTTNLIPHGLLLRGGVARGKLVHQGTIAFGPAIHEAYHLESTVASSPRIILSKELAAEWVEDGVDGEVPWRMSGDGYRFYNFLPPFFGNPFFYNSQDLWKTRLKPVRDLIISKALDRNCPEAVFAKYEWLAGYFDTVCAENAACGVDMVLLEAARLRWGH